MDTILLILFIIAGVLSLIFALVIITIGSIKESKGLMKSGKLLMILPISCIVGLFFYYFVLIPWSNHRSMKSYSGTYYLDNYEDVHLVLKDDGTYLSDSLPNLNFSQTGTWKTGEIDGYFSITESNRHSHIMKHSFDRNRVKTVSFDLNNNKLNFRKVYKP